VKIGKLRSAIPLAIALCVMLLTLSFFRRATKLPDPPTLRVGMTWQEATAEIPYDFHTGFGPGGGWSLSFSLGPNIWGEVLYVSVFFDREYRVTQWQFDKSVPTHRPRPGDAWYDPIRRLFHF
jgi:hypothetical protein